MGKEKAIGALIFIFALLILIYYTWGLLILELVPDLRTWVDTTFGQGTILANIFNPSPVFLLIIPVWLAAVLISVIAMWIGWTMITTPSADKMEDFDFEPPEPAEGEGTEDTPTESTE